MYQKMKGLDMTRKEALVKFLDCEANDLRDSDGFMGNDDPFFEYGRKEYMVLTDQEANDKAREYILDSIWAFNPEFLACHALDGIDSDVIRAIQANEKCESNNKPLAALIKDLDHFVHDAILSDGRGHFLGTYDSEENEGGEYFIYRLN